MNKTKKKKRLTDSQIYDRLIIAGDLMSNVLYNMNQDYKVPPAWRRLAQECQARWDLEYQAVLGCIQDERET